MLSYFFSPTREPTPISHFCIHVFNAACWFSYSFHPGDAPYEGMTELVLRGYHRTIVLSLIRILSYCFQFLSFLSVFLGAFGCVSSIFLEPQDDTSRQIRRAAISRRRIYIPFSVQRNVIGQYTLPTFQNNVVADISYTYISGYVPHGRERSHAYVTCMYLPTRYTPGIHRFDNCILFLIRISRIRF